MPDESSQVFGLSSDDKNKLQQLLSDHANGTLARRPQQYPQLIKESGHRFATCYGTMPAAESNLCPGIGEMKLLIHLIESDPDACLQQTDELITVYNPSATEYADGDILIVQREARDGQWWIIPTGSGQDIIHFELQEPMSFGGHALAHKLVYVAGSWTVDEEQQPVRVYDWYSGMWSGATGYRGLAITRNGDTSEETIDEVEIQVALYDVIWMERIASWIEFSLTEYMGETNAGEASASVVSYDHQGKDPGSTVTVFDPSNRFLDAHNGASGSALYDHSQEEYRIISCQRLAMHAVATLASDCCGSTTATIENFAELPVGNYIGTVDTEPSTIDNPRKHAGVAGDKVLLLRTNDSHTASEWEIIDIERHSTTIITDLQVNGLDIERKKRTIYVEYCDTAPSWEVFISGTECGE